MDSVDSGGLWQLSGSYVGPRCIHHYMQEPQQPPCYLTGTLNCTAAGWLLAVSGTRTITLGGTAMALR
jgi:hypothetical protein